MVLLRRSSSLASGGTDPPIRRDTGARRRLGDNVLEAFFYGAFQNFHHSERRMNEKEENQEDNQDPDVEAPVKKKKYKILPHQKPSLGMPTNMSPSAKKRMRDWASNHASRLRWLEKL